MIVIVHWVLLVAPLGVFALMLAVTAQAGLGVVGALAGYILLQCGMYLGAIVICYALIDEQVRPWSYMKFPYLRALGPEAGWYRVGPLARVQNCGHIATPRAEQRRQQWRARGGVQHGALATHAARMIEMLHAAEVIGELLADPAACVGELVVAPPATRPGEGVGVIEAPRGTLIHHYRIGADDLVQWCNLIVSTTHNNQALHETVRAVADEYFDGREVTEGLLNHVEVAIRAYDPCLSCATHALGSMPLELALVGADGQRRGGLRRDGDGRLTALDAA